MTSPIEIVEVRSPAERAQSFAIRRRVFVEEQGVPAALEFDDLDGDALHLLARDGNQPLGTLRVRFLAGGVAKIERVAVRLEGRGRGVGLKLVAEALRRARAGGAAEALLHAQVHVRGFYERQGFIAFGEPFMEDGILHVAMRRALDEGRLEVGAA